MRVEKVIINEKYESDSDESDYEIKNQNNKNDILKDEERYEIENKV